MLVLVTVLMLVQGGLRPNPDALPPPADFRMTLNGCVTPPSPERQTRQFREHLTAIMNRQDLKLTEKEVALIKSVHNAAVPAAFSVAGDARERLKEADQTMRSALSKVALEAIRELPPIRRYVVC
jgi:hypothetical protein